MGLRISNKGVFFISFSQFGIAFSFHCILAFIPFYITKISPFGPKETIIWIGLILGAANAVASVTASFWGGLTSRFRPKLLFEGGILANGILTLLMGFTTNLYLLLLLRVMQGVLGGVSTIGLILISSLSQRESLHKDLSLFQNAMTAGQLIGPPVGAYTASLFGYRSPFVLAFIIVSIFLIFCHYYVSDIPPQEKKLDQHFTYQKGILLAWGLIFMATIHLTFLPSILPIILQGFQLAGDRALKTAGFIIMTYTLTAIIGTYLFSRLSSIIGIKRVITIACLSAALFQVLLILSRGVLSFMVIRMIQMGSISVIFPLAISLFAREVGGKTMGFLNASRFVGSAIGPLMGTFILAYFNLLTLYLFITGLTLLSLWAFLNSTKEV